jgi:serine/threonine protein kinase
MANASAEAIDLLKQMQQLDPTKRPGAGQALQHPWFAGMTTPIAGTVPSSPPPKEAAPPPGEPSKPKPVILHSNSDAPAFDDIFDGLD